jgi:hypothetical protein
MSTGVHLSDHKRLVLHTTGLGRRIKELFDALSRNDELQNTFIESPIEVIGSEILGINYTKEQASAVNRFIFSVLANKDLQKWATDYDKANVGKTVIPEQRFKDLAQAFIKFGDPTLMEALLQSAASGADIPGLVKAALIVKAESVAIGNWFIYKVSGRLLGDEDVVLPAVQVQRIAEQLVARAQQLRSGGEI